MGNIPFFFKVSLKSRSTDRLTKPIWTFTNYIYALSTSNDAFSTGKLAYSKKQENEIAISSNKRLISHLPKLIELILQVLESIRVNIDLSQLIPNVEDRANGDQSKNDSQHDNQSVHAQQTLILEDRAVSSTVLRRAEAASGLQVGVVATHSMRAAEVVLQHRAVYN